MRKVRCKCDANAVRCDAMSFEKKCECECNAKKFSHYHPWFEGFFMGSIMGSLNIMGSDYGSNISVSE